MKYKSLSLTIVNNGEGAIETYDLRASTLYDSIEILAITLKSIEQIYLNKGLEFVTDNIKGLSDILRVDIIKKLKGHDVNVPLIPLDFHVDFNEESIRILQLTIDKDTEEHNDKMFSEFVNVLIVHLSSCLSDLLRSLNKPIMDNEVISVVEEFFVDVLTEDNKELFNELSQMLEQLYDYFD